MKMTINESVIEGTPEELATYEAMIEDFAKADSCEDVCCVEEALTDVGFSNGDLVKITGLSKYGANLIGQIGVVKGEATSSGFYYVKVEGKTRVYSPKDFELFAEKDKWTKLGRKVNEYRKGDLVYVTLDNDEVVYNEVVGINTTFSDTRYYVKSTRFGVSTEKPESLTLIAPAESIVNVIPID